ncbi:MAG: gamma-glutamyltransferase [Armatimonadota bacterium]
MLSRSGKTCCLRRGRITILAAVLLAAGAISKPALAAPPAYGPQQARAPHGMVASAEPLASSVGVAILKKGGNAVDAAVAVGLALAVTYPEAGNLGGGGFLLLRLADGRTTAIDFRETAPAKASRTMYLGKDGRPTADSRVGYRAVGIPGTVAGLALAQSRYGRLKWRDVVAPAVSLAGQGFPVTDYLARILKGSKALSGFAESRRVFQRSGRPYAEGDLLRQPDLAATLRRLMEKGPREFYEGQTAILIARDMAANGGLITREDLRTYTAIERAPLRGTYRGYDILTMPPPSSGGACLLEMLNILEPHDIKSLGYGSSASDHLLIESMRRAFADRSELFGDPAFVKVPARGLSSKAYAAERSRTIDSSRATPSKDVGIGNPAPYESQQTTHYSVVDAVGNAVSCTYTLNNSFGSGVTAKGTGIILNNEMDDFAAKPGTPNGFGLVQGERNAVAPKKRPLSSMTPTILTRGSKLFMVIGSPGGPTIITTVLQTIVNVIDHGMSLPRAITAGRLHHQWLPDAIDTEEFAAPAEVRSALEKRGHVFNPKGGFQGGKRWGNAQGILVEPNTGIRIGASDPRGTGAAIGY